MAHGGTTFIGSLIEDTVAHRLQSLGNYVVSSGDDHDAPSSEELLLADIDSLQTVTARFKRQLNQTRSPIFRLPPEILQIIIQLVVRSFKRGLLYELCDPRGWILLGRVSHRFRIMLLAMHALWADIVFDSHLKGAHEVLFSRAQDAPINVVVRSQTTSQEADNFAIHHLEQAQSISARSIENPEPLRSVMDQLVKNTYMHLEELELAVHLHEYRLPEEQAVCVAGAHFISAAAGQYILRAPKLRSLSLWSAFVPFDASGLTSLSLKRLAITDDDVLQPEYLLGILRCCINVQDLDLSNYIPDLSSSVFPPPSKRIVLPALQRLSLYDLRQRILQLWSLIDIPCTVLLKIDFCSLDNLLDQLYGARTFADHVVSQRFLPITRLEIRHTSDDGLSFELMMPENGLFGNFISYAFVNGHQDPSAYHRIFEFSALSDGWDGLDMKQHIQQFVGVFRLSEIRTLEISYRVLEAFANPFQALVALFPSLQVLSIHEIASTFFEPPAEAQNVTSRHPFNVLLLPKVHTLALASEEPEVPLTLEHVERLSALLTSRIQNRTPIHALELAFAGTDESRGKAASVELQFRDILEKLVDPGQLELNIY